MNLTPGDYFAAKTPVLRLALSTYGVMCAGLLFKCCIGAVPWNLSGCYHIDEK
jgi:hypothetical protein